VLDPEFSETLLTQQQNQTPNQNEHNSIVLQKEILQLRQINI
jgi:hypothetical protein